MAEEEDEEKRTIESVMGFSGFGKTARGTICDFTDLSTAGKKAAMQFDVEKMFAETRRSAQEYTQSVASECCNSIITQ